MSVTPEFEAEGSTDVGYQTSFSFSVQNLSNTTLTTGYYAWFIQLASGKCVGDVTAMQQSIGEMITIIKPKRSFDYLRGGDILPAVFTLPANDPVVRVIYHDGISCFSWEVKPTAKGKT